MEWDATQIDETYRETTPVFLEGEELARRQGIPDFIEEYRMSRLKDAIAVRIMETASNPSAVILDAGCGHGWYPLRLAQSPKFQARLVCVDISAHNIKLLEGEIIKRGIADKISAKVANCERMSFPPDSFDLVYATESVEHIKSPDLFFNEASRILKPGGKLIVTTPSAAMHSFWKTVAVPLATAASILKSGKIGEPKRTSFSIPERPLSKKELLNAIEASGLKIREYRGAVFLPHESCYQFIPTWISKLLLFRARLFEKLVPLTAWSALHRIAVAEKSDAN